MSVFTPVSPDEARALLARYTLGELESLEGIAQGIENTNYFLDTTTGRYVLTLFEKIPREDLPFYVGLMHHLAEHDIRCPAPMALQEGGFLSELCGKPAVVVTRLPGVPHLSPTPEQCRKVGRILADIHEAGLEYDAGLANWRGQAWREGFAQGVIHGDLFRDNVLWDDEGEGGVIDFYFACDDALLYDVAITVNDWCTDSFATLDPDRADALLEGYDAHRPLTDLEREMWPVMLRRAALRTWLGRLEYNHFPQAAEMTIPKDHAW